MVVADLIRKVSTLNVQPEMVLDSRLAELVKAKSMYDIGAINEEHYREVRRNYLSTLMHYQKEQVSIAHLYWFAFQKAMGAR